MNAPPNKSRVIVIGGGQAGLATGYHLKRSGVPFEIIDANDRVGDSWRKRYASLTLFTPRWMNALPGLAMPGNREGYPDKDEFADYLERYVLRVDVPIALKSRVVRLSKRDGAFVAELDDGSSRRADAVVIATGGFQSPVVPELAKKFADDVEQLTADTFKKGSQVSPGPVLVVGDGASGRDIALECAATHRVLLARGKPRKLLPVSILGKSVWWWLHYGGLLKAGPESMIGRRIRALDAFPDRGVNETMLQARGIEILPRLMDADGSTAVFGHGQSRQIKTVVWAIGYRDDFGWIEIEGAKAGDGTVLHEAGVSPVPGIYYVGRPWQRNRASALAAGASADAATIANFIVRDRPW